MKFKLTIFFTIIIIGNAISQAKEIIDDSNDSIKIYHTYISKNTSNAFAPIRYKDGLIYLSDNKSKYVNFYYTDLKSKIVKIDIQNQFNHAGPATIIENKNEIYFTMNSDKLINIDPFNNSRKLSNLSIFMGEIKEFKVQNISELNFCIYMFSYACPTITDNGDHMIIVTNESGNYQLIEYVKKDENTWVKGDIIYTSIGAQILNPTLIDNDCIYFSSNMENGLGKYDIYKIIKINGKWQIPENVNFLNSKLDELGVNFIDKKSGYLSTNRFNGIDNIYYFEMKK